MTRPTAFLLLIPLLSAGCASGVLSTRGSNSDIEILKERVLELQKQARVSEVELAELRRQVSELEARLASGRSKQAASARPPAMTGPVPRRSVEPLSRPPSGDRDSDLEETIVEVDLEPLPRSAAAVAPSAGREPSPSAPPSAPAPRPAPQANVGSQPLSAAAQALYDRGYTLYHQGRFVDAEASFQRFLQSYAGSDLADNAQYWIGEARYGRGDLRSALAAFKETIERYPEGNKVADSLLKAGQCLEGLRDLEGARASYREVRRRFPKTAAAAVAEERMARLR